MPEDMEPNLRVYLVSRMARLYERIIEFQVRSVIHIYRCRTKHFICATINCDDWKSRLQSMKADELELKIRISGVQSAQSLKALKQFCREPDESCKQLDNTLNKFTNLLRLIINLSLTLTNVEPVASGDLEAFDSLICPSLYLSSGKVTG